LVASLNYGIGNGITMMAQARIAISVFTQATEWQEKQLAFQKLDFGEWVSGNRDLINPAIK